MKMGRSTLYKMAKEAKLPPTGPVTNRASLSGNWANRSAPGKRLGFTLATEFAAKEKGKPLTQMGDVTGAMHRVP